MEGSWPSRKNGSPSCPQQQKRLQTVPRKCRSPPQAPGGLSSSSHSLREPSLESSSSKLCPPRPCGHGGLPTVAPAVIWAVRPLAWSVRRGETEAGSGDRSGSARECGTVIPLEAVPVPFAPPCVTCSSAAGCWASLRPHGAGAGSAQGLGRAGPSFSTYFLRAYCVPAARAQTGRHLWPRGDSPIDCLQRTDKSAPSAPQTKRGSGAVSGCSGPHGAAGPVAKPPACP